MRTGVGGGVGPVGPSGARAAEASLLILVEPVLNPGGRSPSRARSRPAGDGGGRGAPVRDGVADAGWGEAYGTH